MVEIIGKISKQGNSYFLRIPKDLVDCKVFSLGQEITVRIEDNQNFNKAAEVSDTQMPLTFQLVRDGLISTDHINSINLMGVSS